MHITFNDDTIITKKFSKFLKINKIKDFGRMITTRN